ncbi:hypothetical protein [Chenggangzhangella methanolivorans]|uniref:Uncharacterized protein n=1 Tax=Chenggangzhangella methanolivorans TaxID=1437009 RepID=A0A9E6R6W2_9HYPH|nr:hypothetical protein [Chenggangzhangella methanolivorans]QZN98394.1 hypothetical protein K6K41_14930 [Chenggangzhangella methanolivorans]
MIRLLLAGMALVSTLGSAAVAQSYQASRDFTRDNPTGVWLFGYGTASSRSSLKPLPFQENYPEDGFDAFYTRYTVKRDGPFPPLHRVGVGLGRNSVTVAGEDSGVLAPNMLAMLSSRRAGSSPDTYDTIVRFKAPESGVYAFEGYYALIDDQADQGFTPLIYLGGQNLSREAFGKTGFVLAGEPADPAARKLGATKNFKFSLKMKKNAQVFFSVRHATRYIYANARGVGFDVRVTPQ